MERITGGKLLQAQARVQELTLDLGQRAQLLWLTTRNRILAQVHADIAELIHPDLRPLRRLEIGSLCPSSAYSPKSLS